MFSSPSYGPNTTSPNPLSLCHQFDRTPSIRKDLVYLAEWMCKFNVLVVVLRQLSV
jgi:hypothetical protein